MMKMPWILAATALIAVGCDQQRQASADRNTAGDKSAVREQVRDAKEEIDREARARKEMLDAEAKAAQAKIDAEKARAKAQQTDAESKVESATQTIREAAGAAGARSDTEAGAARSDTSATPPQSRTDQSQTPSPSAANADQRLVGQVRTALKNDTDAAAGLAETVQISASNGTVTLKGTVRSEAEKMRIENAAKGVPGVTKVENQLEVKAE